MKKLYQYMASCQLALANCIISGNKEWEEKWRERCEHISKELLPSGSGFDCGSKFDYDRSPNGRLLISTEYHHMDSNGMYAGWTSPITITVLPDLQFGFVLRLNCHGSRLAKPNDKEYFYDLFSHLLDMEIEVDKETGLDHFPRIDSEVMDAVLVPPVE